MDVYSLMKRQLDAALEDVHSTHNVQLELNPCPG